MAIYASNILIYLNINIYIDVITDIYMHNNINSINNDNVHTYMYIYICSFLHLIGLVSEQDLSTLKRNN